MYFVGQIKSLLYVVTAISNPCRYRSRSVLYRDFAKRVKDAGAELLTVEATFGEREHDVTSGCSSSGIQLRTSHELWHKENLLNVGIGRLPPEAKYIAWIDADVAFSRADWAVETVHQLQHFPVVQMWSYGLDLGPHEEPLGRFKGFARCWMDGDQMSGHMASSKSHATASMGSGAQGSHCDAVPGSNAPTTSPWHTGYAWAARREALDQTGGLLDWAILGAADRHMAMAMIGRGADSCDARVHPHYRGLLLQWQKRAAALKQNIGAVDTTLLHYWHGKKADRRYRDRWQILVRNQFDPIGDLTRDSQGVWQLVVESQRQVRLRDELREYFRARNEDSIDV